jgi:DNA excision repair protein ERCC-8
MSLISWERKDSNYNLISLLIKSQYNKNNSLLFNKRLNQRRFQTIDLSTRFEIKSGHCGDNSNSQAYCLSLDNQDCRYLLSGGSDGLVALYDLETYSNDQLNNSDNNELNDISNYKTNIILPLDKSRRHNHHLSSIQWHPSDTGAFLTSGFDGNLFIWDTNSFEVAGSFQLATSASEICKIFHARLSTRHSGLIACALSIYLSVYLSVYVSKYIHIYI